MTVIPRRAAGCCVALATLAIAGPVSAGGFSYEFLSGDPYGVNPYPAAVSGNGRYVVGGEGPGTGGTVGFVWSRETGVIDIPQPVGLPPETAWLAYVRGISEDGGQIIGTAYVQPDGLGGTSGPFAAALPRSALTAEPSTFPGHEIIDAPTVPPPGEVYDVATVNNALILVGTTNTTAPATVWIDGNPLALHSVLGPDESDYSIGAATTVSANGAYAAGWSEGAPGVYVATRWNISTQQPEALGELTPGGESMATHLSADGSVVVGWAIAPSGRQEAFRWTSATGMVSLGTIVVGQASLATVVSPDGSMVFGQADVGNLLAFVWTQAGGMRLLKDYLETELGIPLEPGSFPADVRDISLDGRTIVGWDFSFGGFVADLGCLDDDDDGLCNDWEMSGVDINNDGVIDLPIHTWGATPDHKDLFVEVDAMFEYAQPAAVGDLVEAAFAAAPVTNPDGVDGVRLHYMIDEDEQEILPEDFGSDPMEIADRSISWQEFDEVRDLHFGTPDERADPNWEHIKAARLATFRYAIWGRKIGDGKTLGRAEIFGNDLMLGLNTQTASLTDYSQEEVASIFMHEFGHNLGLRHGGGDDTNYKPHYMSIMNYLYTMQYGIFDGTWALNYSPANQGALNESALNETSGVPDGGDASLASRVMIWTLPLEVSDGSGSAMPNGMPVDWNGDGDTTDTMAMVDVNAYRGPSPGQTLVGFDDWDNIQIAPRGSLAFSDFSSHPQTTADLPDEEDMVEAFTTLRTELGAGCAADLNGDGAVDGMDLAGLLAQWGMAGAADLDGTGTVDGMDLAGLLASWGPCS